MEVVKLDAIIPQTRGSIEPPKDSVIATILPIVHEPAIILYGPTKSGKTRLAAWEASALATKLNRRVLFMLTESNIEPQDVRDILAACIYHNVYCEINRFDTLHGLRSFINRIQNTIRVALRRESSSVLNETPRVVVIDSLTGLANLIIEGLSDQILESGAPTALPYLYPPITSIINPLRRLLSDNYLSGYLIMTAHETQLRGEKYMPTSPVKSKPRYTGAAQYNDDAEVYLGTPRDMPSSLKTCSATRSSKVHRPLIVVRSRRFPECEGRGVAIAFERVSVVGEGTIEVANMQGGVQYIFTPKDMMANEKLAKKIEASVLIPRIGCGPKCVG